MSGKPIAPAGLECPLFRKDVSKVCHKCAWYTLVRGKNPQTGIDVDEWGCAISFGPMLTLETARQSRSAAAAVETLRNEVAKSAEVNTAVLFKLADNLPDHRLPPPRIDLIESSASAKRNT